jgi:hypothetical protein
MGFSAYVVEFYRFGTELNIHDLIMCKDITFTYKMDGERITTNTFVAINLPIVFGTCSDLKVNFVL